MISKIEKLPKSKIKFHIITEAIETAHFFDMALSNMAKELKISGFRPGKVPADVAKGAIGDHAVMHEAQDLAINDTYTQMISKEKIVPIARPENVKVNKFSEEDGIDWEGEVDILPTIDMKGWQDKLKAKSSKLKVEEIKVEEKEIDDTLSSLQKQFSDLEKKEPAKEGDIVLTEKGDWVSINMDVAEKERFNPEQLKKFKADGFAMIIGEANFIPGFEDELIGLKIDEEKVFDAQFPENYHEKSLANTTVKFQVKINEIRKIVSPELNDKFSENFGFKKIGELRKAIGDDTLKRKEEQEKMRFEDEVLKAVASGIEVEIPDSLVEQEKDMIVSRFVHDLENHKGIKFMDYLTSLGKNEKEFKDGFGEHAVNNVKLGLVLGQIRNDEKIEVADSDIEEARNMDIINQTAGHVGEKVGEIENMIRERYKDDQFIESVKNSILARKTIDLIVEQNKS